MQEHLVIIGGVAAGAKAAAKARRENPDLKISIYNEGNHISYSACGLPYYIENVVTAQDKLLIRSPETFKSEENIDIYIRYRIEKIIPDQKKVLVENLNSGERFEVEYSKLLIATGSRPVIPTIDGANLNNVFTLRTIEDAKEIKDIAQNARKAVVIGAGYIGTEMIESFHNLGLEVTDVEYAHQILPLLDQDIASQVQKYLEDEKKIKIITNDGIKRLIGDEDNNVKQIETNSGKIIDADIALISVGVTPNIEIAQAAGVKIGETGAIKVNERMETNIPDIYAAGDCVEEINIVTGKPTWIPLGSTANKQGRIAAINMTGGHESFKGVLGSLVTKIFDYNIAKTGISEKEAQKYNYNYATVVITHKDKSGYYPGAKDIVIKLVADKPTRKLLGAQIIGKGDVDKRINVVATALTAEMTIDNFLDIDLTYAPPYSPAIDPILTAAQVLQTELDKKKGKESSQTQLKKRQSAA